MIRTMTLLALLAASVAAAAPCDRVQVTLISSSQPDMRNVGDPFNLFDGPDDHGIYYSAADWVRDPEESVYLDGLVDVNFGMNFGNAGPHPEGFDRQVKQLHEYILAPAVGRGITADSLVSATLQLHIDDVLDMTMSGATDLVGPQWVYVNVFAGDGLLVTLEDAQIDYDRCDRKDPASWDVIHELVSAQGNRISDDEIDTAGGRVVVDIPVTTPVRDLFAGAAAYAGFTLAASEDGDYVLLSVDGGQGTLAQLPRLLLIGGVLGDFDATDTVDLQDFARLQRCFGATELTPADACLPADLDQDDDVDLDDLALFEPQMTGPAAACPTGSVAWRSNAPGDRQVLAPAPRFFGDFNADGAFDAADRAFFEACHAASAPESACITADLDGDGLLSPGDVELFGRIFAVSR